MRPGDVCGDTPGTAVKVIRTTMHPVWSVWIVHLDVLVQNIPFPFPAVDRTAMHAAFIRDYLQWQSVTNQQLHGNCSRFWEIRIGRIGHGRLLSVMVSTEQCRTPTFFGSRDVAKEVSYYETID